MAKAIVITDTNFEEVVLGADKPVLVDFWAPWCGPCRIIGPIVEEIASEMEGQAVIGKVDVDQSPSIAEKFRVMSIPTLLIFKDGQVVDKHVGANITKTALSGKVAAHA
ncbi:MAG: thioredoxin [Bacteroidia bacterium]